jgi:hypothetical protein
MDSLHKGLIILYKLQLSCILVAKQESNPITGLDRHRGFQEVEAPRFQDNRHMKVVRLSALRTGRRPFHMALQPNAGYGLLIHEVFEIIHRTRHSR